jgi:hypothetical protein
MALITASAAGGRKWSTVVTFTRAPDLNGNGKIHASGSLSTSEGCRSSRLLKLLLLDDANDSVLATLDRTSSDVDGGWRLKGTMPANLPSTPIAVQVKATKRSARKVLCRAGLSPVVQVAAPASG